MTDLFEEDFVEDVEEYYEGRNEMGSVNHSLVQANLTGMFYSDARFIAATELSLDVQDADIREFFRKAKKELKPDVCLYDVDSSIEFIEVMDTQPDVLRTPQMPLLAVEILSPTDRVADATDKVRAYLKLGVKSCWLVYPDVKVVVVYSHGNQPKSFDITTGEVIDEMLGIKLPVHKIFATGTKIRTTHTFIRS